MSLLPSIAALLLGAPAVAAAQEAATLEVVLLERGSGLPIAADLEINGQPYTASNEGRLQLDVPAGSLSLKASSPEHLPKTAELSLRPGQTLRFELRLDRVSWAEEVIVYGAGEASAVQASTFTREELDAVPGAFGDPIRALQSLPSMARPSSVEGSLVVRGASASSTAVLVDGLPVPYLFHFLLGRSVIPPDLVDEIEVIPGGAPARYGASSQAVVDTHLLKKDVQPGVHGRVGVDILDGSVGLTTRFGPWSLAVSGRYSWVGGLVGLSSRIASVAQGNRWKDATYVEPWYGDATVLARYDQGPDTVDVLFIGAADRLTFRIGEEAEPDISLAFDPSQLYRSGFWRIRTRWQREVGAHRADTWVAIGTDGQRNLLQGLGLLGEGVEFGQVRQRQAHVRHAWTLSLPEDWSMNVGSEAVLSRVVAEDYSNLVMPEQPVPQDGHSRLRSHAWVDARGRVGRWHLMPGLRLSGYALRGKLHGSPEPRIGVRYEASDVVTWTGFAGAYSQLPRPEQTARLLGDPSLPIHRSVQLGTGVEARWPSGLSLESTLYGTRFAPTIAVGEELVSTLADDDGAVVARDELRPVYQALPGWAFGVETMLRFRPNHRFFGWISLTLSRSLRQWPDGTLRAADRDQPVAATAVAAWNAPQLWQLSTRARVTSGHPYTPLYEAWNPWYDFWVPQPGETNSARFPVFFQLDVRVQKTFVAKRARWSVYLDIANTTNQKNYLLATYTPNYARLVPAIWIPIIPNLGLEVDF